MFLSGWMQQNSHQSRHFPLLEIFGPIMDREADLRADYPTFVARIRFSCARRIWSRCHSAMSRSLSSCLRWVVGTVR